MLKREYIYIYIYIYIPFLCYYIYIVLVPPFFRNNVTENILLIRTAVSGMFAQIGVVLNRTTTVDSHWRFELTCITVIFRVRTGCTDVC